MNIRLGQIADIPWLLELGDRAQREAPNYAQLHGDVSTRYKRLVLLLQSPTLVHIAVCDDQSGFICGAVEPSIWFEEAFASVNLLYVVPEKRSTSRAWRLLASFEQWGKALGAAGCLTNVTSGVQEELTARFYRKMGYQPQGLCFYKEF